MSEATTPSVLSPEMLWNALDALHEGIQILSPEFRYLWVNEAVARHGRKPASELVGRTMMECYPGIERTPLFSVLRRCMEERREDRLENEFEYGDGKRAWFELRIRPCEAGLVVASLDMTDRKTIEAKLESAYAQALRDLETPVLRVHDGVLLAPIIGALAAPRAQKLTENVLSCVVEDKARVVILDVTGMPELDTHVAQHLLQATAMIRLLGAATILTGLTAAAATALVHLGVDLGSMKSTSSLSEGLELALLQIGKRVVRQTR